MPAQYSLVQGLEKASQRHEKEIVVELNLDRVAHYVGFYLPVLLSIIAKATEFIGNPLSCYPVHNETGYSTFTSYATSYCWDSYSADKCNSTSLGTGIKNSNLTKDEYNVTLSGSFHNPNIVRGFIQWMPYALLLQACLFAMPSILWHFVVGARLIGHLKFMQSLIAELYEKFKIIPAGIYSEKPYDEKGIYLDGWAPFDPKYKNEKQLGMDEEQLKNSKRHDTHDDDNNRQRDKERKIYHLKEDSLELTLENVASVCAQAELSDDGSDVDYSVEERKKDEREEQKLKKLNIIEKFLVGNMIDQHLFSMLCYENFASMEHYPYILSVYQLTSTPAAEKDPKGIVPMLQGILRTFFHKRNLTGHFLIKTYLAIRILCILLGLILLVISLHFSVIVGSLHTFECKVPYHDVCLVCILKGNRDVIATFLANLAVIFIYTGCSVYQLYFVRSGSQRALCKYFEVMSDSFSVALLSAHKAARDL